MTTYYVDGTDGNDSNAGTSEGSGNAWLTIDKAASTVAAGDKVYVKATGTYSEEVTLDTAGTNGSFIIFEGYTSTVGDNGKVTIDGATYCVNGAVNGAYYSWRNFIFTGASNHGFYLGNADSNSFYNCEFTANANAGIWGDNSFAFVNCEFTNNSGIGCDVDAEVRFIGCIFSGNTGAGVPQGCIDAYIYKCLFFGNATNVDALAGAHDVIIACTFDGDGNTLDCIGDGSELNHLIVDNIMHDFGGNGVSQNSSSCVCVRGYNLFSSITGSLYAVDNDPAYGAISGYQDPAEQAPAFEDEANDNYAPSTSSPAVGAQLVPGGIT